MNLKSRNRLTKAMMQVAAFAFSTLLFVPIAFAADPPTETRAVSVSSAAETAAGTKRALIVCGLSGDAEHHAKFAETMGKLHEGLTQHLGFAGGDVVVLFGDEPDDSDGDVIKSSRRATRDELEKTVKGICDATTSDDTLWVIVLGHSHYDGLKSWVNLPGPDIQQVDFAKLFHDLPAREQVFFITTPTSGIYIKPLAAKGRVVISATEEGWETNETDFPHELARVLSSPPPTNEFDLDADGSITLFDLYITAARNVAQSYHDGELLATEHPLLDDNGDGRGTELQIDYLTVEQGGRASPRKSAAITPRPNSDGSLANSIRLPFPFKESPPLTKNESPEPADALVPSNREE